MKEELPVYHIPALAPETIQGLDIKPDGTYVDVTFGGGGHSRALMSCLGPNGRLFSFDQDEYDAERLTTIFRLYGELKNAKRMADCIVKARASKDIVTIADLLNVVRPLINPRQEKKELAQVFQALRMEVNHEVDALQEFLEQTLTAIRPGGRLAIITYHSIEDRMVKNFMRSGRIDGKVETDFFGRRLSPIAPLSGKPIVPSDEEVERNPRARSAKLRVAIIGKEDE